MCKLLMPHEVDFLLRYPRGRSARLAREGKLPSITLPDGGIRFDEAEVLKLLSTNIGFPVEALSTAASLHLRRVGTTWAPIRRGDGRG